MHSGLRRADFSAAAPRSGAASGNKSQFLLSFSLAANDDSKKGMARGDELKSAFVSNGHADADGVDILAEDLYQPGQELFFDELKVGPGDALVMLSKHLALGEHICFSLWN